LNNSKYISIWVPEEAAMRWLFNATANEFLKAVGMDIIGRGIDVADMIGEESLGTDMSAFFTNGKYKSFVGGNGAIFPIVRGFIEQFPNMGIQNQYQQGNLMGGVLNFLSESVAQVGSLVGGLSPNLNFRYQMPQAWQGSQQDALDISFQINPYTLGMLPCFDGNKNVGGNTMNGADVMVACLMLLVMGAPRNAGLLGADTFLTKGLQGFMNSWIKSPPILDVQIGSLYIPSMHVQSIKIQFPSSETNVYDTNGWPMLANISMSLIHPYCYTQSAYIDMARRIGEQKAATLIQTNTGQSQEFLSKVPRI